MRQNWLAGHLEEVPFQGQRTCLVEGLRRYCQPVVYCDTSRREQVSGRANVPRPGGGAIPGAPLEPGKALKEGGGPYGFPGAVVSQKVSFLYHSRLVLGPRTSVWVVCHLELGACRVRAWLVPDLYSKLLLGDTVAW